MPIHLTRTGVFHRREDVEAVNEVLFDLRGMCVGRLALRGDRMIVFFRSVDRAHPEFALRLMNVSAFRDSGVMTAELSRGELQPIGSWGRDVAVAEDIRRPETLSELALWNEDDEAYPRFQALVQSVEVVETGDLRNPNELWRSFGPNADPSLRIAGFDPDPDHIPGEEDWLS